jgi:hypothetical protein
MVIYDLYTVLICMQRRAKNDAKWHLDGFPTDRGVYIMMLSVGIVITNPGA